MSKYSGWRDRFRREYWWGGVVVNYTRWTFGIALWLSVPIVEVGVGPVTVWVGK